MIRYIHDPEPAWGGIYCPVIVCDACLHPISSGSGNTYWHERADGEIHPQIWHTHKGSCAQFDRVIADALGGMVLSEELDVWLGQLRHNLKHPLRAAREGPPP